MEFGLECGLRHNTLKELEANYPRDVSRCFTECVALWLRREDDVDRRGKPTPQRLAEIRSKFDKKGPRKGQPVLTCLLLLLTVECCYNDIALLIMMLMHLCLGCFKLIPFPAL